MSNLTLHIDSPVLTYEEFGRRTGMSIHLIRKMVSEGRLPIVPKRKPKDTPFINMLALSRAASEQQFTL
ncbi:DNA-binding protein [Shewanella sp.]|uniref:DNA-binding protein n=1 Tax=Shewanella sp. TaxID=50422 RepID=UPI003A978D46